MSHYGVSIDQHIRLNFSQDLTQADSALCLSVRKSFRSALVLRRRLAQLKLYRQSHFSDAAGSDLNGPNL